LRVELWQTAVHHGGARLPGGGGRDEVHDVDAAPEHHHACIAEGGQHRRLPGCTAGQGPHARPGPRHRPGRRTATPRPSASEPSASPSRSASAAGTPRSTCRVLCGARLVVAPETATTLVPSRASRALWSPLAVTQTSTIDPGRTDRGRSSAATLT